jgi:dihydrofolate synthase/folylpolyglutamate synthase
MTYEEAMQFWLGRVNFEQRTPVVGDFKLERMRHLLALLGNPHRRLRIVHVAGSKGKGSTSAMLASILQRQGYRVGLFTSPHLVTVEERIQVDQRPIAKDELTSLFGEMRERADAAFLETLTFFEIGTGLGFLHFLRRGVDLAVVEVGLGGRFDSTNVCDPLVSIITSISLDHMQILGDTLEQIAFEKAGIIKPGRPTVSGVRHPGAKQVIEAICRERGSQLEQINEDFHYTHVPAAIQGSGVRSQESGVRRSSVQITTRARTWPEMTLGLIGEHQARNAAVAVAAIDLLREAGVAIADKAVADGLAQIVWPARLEVLSRRPLVILDCAHNVASAQALAQALDESVTLADGARRLLIFGGNRDKDLAGMLDVLAPRFDRIFLTSFHGNARCLPPEQLAMLLPAEARERVKMCPDAQQAWQLARREASKIDLICVAGSVFLAGELRPVILALQPEA